MNAIGAITPERAEIAPDRRRAVRPGRRRQPADAAERLATELTAAARHRCHEIIAGGTTPREPRRSPCSRRWASASLTSRSPGVVARTLQGRRPRRETCASAAGSAQAASSAQRLEEHDDDRRRRQTVRRCLRARRPPIPRPGSRCCSPRPRSMRRSNGSPRCRVRRTVGASRCSCIRESTSPGLGLAPGIRVALCVLIPGEADAPSPAELDCRRLLHPRQRRRDHRRRSHRRRQVRRVERPVLSDGWHVNDGDDLHVRLEYSNAPVLEKLHVHLVDPKPPEEPPIPEERTTPTTTRRSPASQPLRHVRDRRLGRIADALRAADQPTRGRVACPALAVDRREGPPRRARGTRVGLRRSSPVPPVQPDDRADERHDAELLRDDHHPSTRNRRSTRIATCPPRSTTSSRDRDGAASPVRGTRGAPAI